MPPDSQPPATGEKEDLYCSECGEWRGSDDYTCRQGGKSVPISEVPEKGDSVACPQSGEERLRKALSEMLELHDPSHPRGVAKSEAIPELERAIREHDCVHGQARAALAASLSPSREGLSKLIADALATAATDGKPPFDWTYDSWAERILNTLPAPSPPLPDREQELKERCKALEDYVMRRLGIQHTVDPNDPVVRAALYSEEPE